MILVGLIVGLCGFSVFAGPGLLFALIDTSLHSEELFAYAFLTGVGALIAVPFALMFLAGVLTVRTSNRKKAQNVAARQKTVEELRPDLISEVQYVGGHPLIPQVDRVVLTLIKPVINIYRFKPDYELDFITSINLGEVTRVRMRPGNDHGADDGDSGYSRDDYEQTPFLKIIFVLEGHTYQTSFENFESPYTPRDWYNKITAMQHQIRTEQ